MSSAPLVKTGTETFVYGETVMYFVMWNTTVMSLLYGSQLESFIMPKLVRIRVRESDGGVLLI